MRKYIYITLFLAIIAILFPILLSGNSPRILIFAKTVGYQHESIEKAIVILHKACSDRGITADTTRYASVFSIENLKRYKTVVFLNTSGDILDDIQQKAFQDYIRGGGGFVGVHAATDTEYEWPWYNQLVGAYFLSHPKQQKAVIEVTDRSHPATSFLPEKWERTDEWYNFKNISKDIKVLANLDEKSYEGGENGNGHPFIWCQEFEGGRSFYTGVGHRDDNYDEPLVIRHLLEAICWAGKIKN
ncbi:MAG: ThuA domain-containing protein [Bacteroidales bacterium]|nr:ThuA domain-containing protein [Bacteroidales bacterium]